jgi:thiosulfate dehydrogenase [quinone] large subunit
MNKQKGFALLRIAFGILWAFDAWLKWQPSFLNGFADQVTMDMSGQPAWITAWIHLWGSIVAPHAYGWAVLVAILQTIIAVGLIFGLFTRTALAIGIVLSLLIWTVPEGFGGPYAPGSTDPGAAIIYVFVFVALWLGASWTAYSIDSKIRKQSY